MKGFTNMAKWQAKLLLVWLSLAVGASLVSVRTEAVHAAAAAATEYWVYEAKGTLHPPVALKDGRLFAATVNGYISVINQNGKLQAETNVYTNLSAPVLSPKGEIWLGGKGARLYRYDAAGKGGQKAIFYFKGKTEGLQPSAAVADGDGLPYMAYQHAVLSLDAEGANQAALLPAGVSVKALVGAASGAYALGSDNTLYAVRGSELLWQAQLAQPLRGAKLAADPAGGVLLLASGALAAYEADGSLRFMRELAAAPASGWTSPAVLGLGDESVIVAAEAAGDGIAAFRPSDGAERWRVSARGAGGFGPAALAPDPAAGSVLAGARSGALYAIDGKAGTIAVSYGGRAAAAASGVAPLGGGQFAYASAAKLYAAGPVRPVALGYAAASIKLPLGQRLLITDKLKLSVPVALRYSSDKPAVVRISDTGIVTAVAAGKANLTIAVASASYSGQLKLPIEVTAAAAAKVRQETRKVSAAGRSFTVQTVVVPKGMPVTAGFASRKVGAVQSLHAIAASYRADAAINGTYFESYGGIPEPYGMLIADGRLEHIGNTGTSIGFTWDGKVLMDSLRVKIVGGTDDSYSSPNNWYAYFVNRTPTPGGSAAILYTPKRGSKLGFAMGTAVTVNKGVVTKVAKNHNADIPATGYVLVFAGAEEKLAERFKVGTKVDYKVEMTNLAGQTIDWSKVHTAIGAGPRLVKDGKLAVNPAAEGFASDKILTSSAARSAVLVKSDGTLVLATVSGATMKQWGEIMLKLGAQQAMNMDGGASSGLYALNKYATVPGRNISNALVFGNGLNW